MGAQSPDEITRLLQSYVQIDSSNPPGDTRKAADFLASVFEREGIPVVRYESAPGKAIIYARLKATMTRAVGAPPQKAILLLHHMDVVPADRSQWKMDPFAAIVKGDELWGRGAFDMKGQAVAQIVAFLRLKRDHVPLSRDVILLAEPDEEVGGALGARWMIANHYAELDPEYVLDEGGFGSRDLFAPGKLVYGISVAEKKIVWLKVRAEGVAGHGSQPTDTNPNDRLVRALSRLLAQPPPSGDFSVLNTMNAKVGTFASNKFTNAITHSTIALTWIRSGVGEPAKINVIPSVAEAGLDCRVLPGVTKDQWVDEIKRRLGDPGLKIELINESDDSVISSDETPLYRNLSAAIARRHPDAVITPILIPYGTDSNAFRPARREELRHFSGGAVGRGDCLGMHGDAEHAPLASGIREAAELLFEALRDTLTK